MHLVILEYLVEYLAVATIRSSNSCGNDVYNYDDDDEDSNGGIVLLDSLIVLGLDGESLNE